VIRNNLPRMAALALALVLVGSTAATALINVGDPWTGNSWGQRFEHETDLPFESMRIDWVFGSDFEVPTVFESFDDDSWRAGWESPILAGARGDASTDLEFDIIFNGDVVPTCFTLATYLGGTAQEYYEAKYDETGDCCWTFTADPGTPGPDLEDGEVPEPATLMLLGAGLVGIAGARLRRRRG